MNKERQNRLQRVVHNYEVLPAENKILDKRTGRKNGREGAHGRYLIVNIQDAGKSYTYSFHEVVAFLTYGNLIDKEVNHIDGNKRNNYPENFEVVSAEENRRHQQEGGLLSRVYGEKNGASKLTASKVKCIRRLFKEGASKRKLSLSFGVDRKTVRKIINNETWRNVA